MRSRPRPLLEQQPRGIAVKRPRGKPLRRGVREGDPDPAAAVGEDRGHGGDQPERNSPSLRSPPRQSSRSSDPSTRPVRRRAGQSMRAWRESHAPLPMHPDESGPCPLQVEVPGTSKPAVPGPTPRSEAQAKPPPPPSTPLSRSNSTAHLPGGGPLHLDGRARVPGTAPSGSPVSLQVPPASTCCPDLPAPAPVPQLPSVVVASDHPPESQPGSCASADVPDPPRSVRVARSRCQHTVDEKTIPLQAPGAPGSQTRSVSPSSDAVSIQRRPELAGAVPLPPDPPYEHP